MHGLSRLVAFGIMQTATAENIAGSGLNVQHLKKIYERSGEDGLRSTFTMTNGDGQPRVTNAKRTLEDVVPNLPNTLKQKKCDRNVNICAYCPLVNAKYCLTKINKLLTRKIITCNLVHALVRDMYKTITKISFNLFQ